MKKILVIDDSALMRRLISDIINSEPDVCIADTAENGCVAASYIKEKRQYDCILLDINMPKMDGISFLQFMKKEGCRIPTVMVSSIASRSAKETILALELGACDFVKKPERFTKDVGGDFASQLMQKVRCAFEVNASVEGEAETVVSRQREAQKLKKTEAVATKHRLEKGDLIFIASSTGGPKALQSVIPKIPTDIGCPVVVVQHMPEGFTKSLAERLDDMSQCTVKEAQDDMLLEDGVVYIAKGGFQLYIKASGNRQHRLVVRKDEPRNGLRPCADIFLESLAETSYRNIICGVLTGMGSDGTKGLVHLKEVKNVYTVSQSESTCVVYGMPRSVEKEGVTDVVADIQDVASYLIRKRM